MQFLNKYSSVNMSPCFDEHVSVLFKVVIKKECFQSFKASGSLSELLGL